ncbi:MAG: hypothetical protein ACLP8B_12350 [Xanthobacteraceae bacterium]
MMPRRASAGGIAVCAALAAAISLSWPDPALGKGGDDSDEGSKAASQLPNIYLDLTTTYTAVPANTLSIGFGAPPLVGLLPTGSFPASRNIGINAPLEVDINDRLSVYGGVHATTSSTDLTPWTPLVLDSWNFGFQADVYKQNGGSFPTVTIQSTMIQSTSGSPLITTTSDTYVEFSYALDKDETRGLIAGAKYTRIFVDSPLASVSPDAIGYVGAYYQWPSNWKLTGYAGIQTFGGAQLLNLVTLPGFTQPIVRADLDRMDDNDNRLFGLSAVVAWTPKPSLQVVLRTPLYAVRK